MSHECSSRAINRSPARSATWAASALLIVAACSVGSRETVAAEVIAQPNIIFVMNDDLGWGDVGYHGSEIPTPTIDRLARRGVELDRYYTYAVCSPTRAALLTGRSSLETGVDAPIAFEEALPMGITLLPQHLKGLGYQTALIGKWHLGRARAEYLPFNRGFDYFYGFLGGSIDHNTHLTADGRLDWQRNGVSVREEGHTTDLLTADAIRQIQTRDKGKPLFLFLAYDAPHTPLQAPEAYVRRNVHIADPNRRVFAAMMQHMDEQFARVLATIEAEGISRNTLIIWASDNGHQNASGGSSGGLRGLKSTSFEGGQRVPAIAYWPGHLEGGRRLESVVTILDWFPTLIQAAGGTAPRDSLIVGRNVMPVLKGAEQEPGVSMVMGNRSNRAPNTYYESAYRWPWKVVRAPTRILGPPAAVAGQAALPAARDMSVMLFNVLADPNEQNDIAAQHPDIVAQLVVDLNVAPRAPRSLSEQAVTDAAAAARSAAGAGEAGGTGPAGNAAPPGRDVQRGYTVEKGEPLAEAAARASATRTGR